MLFDECLSGEEWEEDEEDGPPRLDGASLMWHSFVSDRLSNAGDVANPAGFYAEGVAVVGNERVALVWVMDEPGYSDSDHGVDTGADNYDRSRRMLLDVTSTGLTNQPTLRVHTRGPVLPDGVPHPLPWQ